MVELYSWSIRFILPKGKNTTTLVRDDLFISDNIFHINYNSINDGYFAYIGFKSFESREINDLYKNKGVFNNNNKEN
jgi:hypothetical protein